MLTALDLGKAEWTAIARRASWQMTRMNLNTFLRHGVFEEPGMAELVAARLRDPKQIAQARVFPYQLMAAYAMAEDAPSVVRNALQDAMEIATGNVPHCRKRSSRPDVSGSMNMPVTGYRKGSYHCDSVCRRGCSRSGFDHAQESGR
jgi:60 kDa SS-A/Ro ribonucleoprotein